MRKIKAVIFDLDGTLGNTIPLCIEAFRKSIEPLIGKGITDEEITATFGPSEEGTIKALAPTHYDKGISDYLRWYKNLHFKCPTPFEGIHNLLKFLSKKEIGIAMVTGKGVHSTKITLDKFGITHFFDIIETGDSEGPRKQEGIEKVLKYYSGLCKNEVVYVGDAPSDIVACKKTDVPIIAAAWAETVCSERLIELNPDEIFYNINDFNNWIKSNVEC